MDHAILNVPFFRDGEKTRDPFFQFVIFPCSPTDLGDFCQVTAAKKIHLEGLKFQRSLKPSMKDYPVEFEGIGSQNGLEILRIYPPQIGHRGPKFPYLKGDTS